MGTYYEGSEEHLVLEEISNNTHGICKLKKTYMTLISRQEGTMTLGSPDSGADQMPCLKSLARSQNWYITVTGECTRSR